MSERLNVIISSTSQDLESYRDKVASTVVTLDMFPITMKSFHPTGHNPVQISYDKVQQADIFVGIYAFRYGYIPDSSLVYRTAEGEIRSPDGITSITNMEYQWALERGIPILLYVVKEDAKSTTEWANTFEDVGQFNAMKSFRDQILKQHVVGFFDSVDNLTAQVAIAISQLRGSLQKTTAQRPETETRLLQLVETWWIKGALETSLHDRINIDLNYIVETTNPFLESYNNPTNSDLETVKQSKLIETFSRFGQLMLILGAPGSGKTISLLTVARQLIENARNNINHRLPVVLNLSSWQAPLPIEQWLVSELVSKYNIPGRDAQSLVANNKLICLLDGLDEVDDEVRLRCLEAINAYISSFDASIIVCSRTHEYEVLNSTLKVAGRVTVQPLTITAVNQYLDDITGDYDQLKAHINRDQTLGNIILNPLILYIAIVAHRSITETDQDQLKTESDWYEYLFNTYTNKILEIRPADTRREILTNLEWLATKLFQQSRSIFYIDQMGTEMLENQQTKRLIQGVTWAFYGIVAFLTLVLALAVGYDLAYGGLWHVSPFVSIPTAFGIWLVTWVSAGLLVSRLSPEQVEIIVSRQWSGEKITENMRSGIAWGVVYGIVIGLIPTFPMYIFTYIGFNILELNLFAVGVFVFSVCALLFASLLLLTFNRVRRLGLWGGIVAGLIGGLVLAFVSDYFASLFPVGEAIEETLGYPPSMGIGLLAYSLPVGIAIGLGAGITRTWSYLIRVGLNVTRADDNTVIMAPTLKQTTSNARLFSIILAIAGGVSGIIITILVLYATDLAGAFPNRPIIWTILGIPFPLVVGFGGSVIFAMSAIREFGGLVAMQRIMVRYVLRSQNKIPEKYDEFLDQAVTLRLMHKVGIGYRFFHDLFQRHLADGKTQSLHQPQADD